MTQSAAPVANSQRKEWRLTWRCRHRRSCVCSSNTGGRFRCASSRSPSPVPHLHHLLFPFPFMIRFDDWSAYHLLSPFPFLIRFDDWSAGCVPWSLSWSDARLSAQSVRNHRGQFVSAANAGSYLLQCSFLLLVGKDLFHLFVTRGGRIWCCKCDQRIWCYKCDQYQLWMHYPDYYCSQEY